MKNKILILSLFITSCAGVAKESNDVVTYSCDTSKIRKNDLLIIDSLKSVLKKCEYAGYNGKYWYKVKDFYGNISYGNSYTLYNIGDTTSATQSAVVVILSKPHKLK